MYRVDHLAGMTPEGEALLAHFAESLRPPGCDCGLDPDPCPVHGCREPGCRGLAIEGRGYCGGHVAVSP